MDLEKYQKTFGEIEKMQQTNNAAVALMAPPAITFFLPLPI